MEYFYAHRIDNPFDKTRWDTDENLEKIEFLIRAREKRNNFKFEIEIENIKFCLHIARNNFELPSFNDEGDQLEDDMKEFEISTKSRPQKILRFMLHESTANYEIWKKVSGPIFRF
jgi:hypothetical protein